MVKFNKVKVATPNTARYTHQFTDVDAPHSITFETALRDYTVTFKNGEDTVGTDTYTIKDLDITEPEFPAKTGYTGTWEDYSLSADDPKDIVVNTEYTANTYTVVFNGNGATSGEMENQEFTYDKGQNLTYNTFENTGYVFAGWSGTANGHASYANGSYALNITAENNGIVNLYALWKAGEGTPYKIIHKQQDVTGDGYTAVVTHNLTGKTGNSVTSYPNEYEGFNTPEPQVTRISADGSTEIVHLYSRTLHYVTFAIDGKKGDTDDKISFMDVRYGGTVTAPTVIADSGYVFLGWDNPVTTVTETVTYTAVFADDKNNNGIDDTTEPKYTVTYTDGVDDQVIFEDQITKNLLAGLLTPVFTDIPTRAGYTFAGWDMPFPVKVAGYATYTAQWKKIQQAQQNITKLKLKLMAKAK